MTQITQNKSQKWLTVSGRSKQASKHTHARVQWSHLVWGSLRLTPINMTIMNTKLDHQFLPTCH